MADIQDNSDNMRTDEGSPSNVRSNQTEFEFSEFSRLWIVWFNLTLSNNIFHFPTSETGFCKKAINCLLNYDYVLNLK